MQNFTDTDGTTKAFRGVSSTKDLLAAHADGFATIVDGVLYPREGTTDLVDVEFTTQTFGATSRMLASKANARRLGLPF